MMRIVRIASFVVAAAALPASALAQASSSSSSASGGSAAAVNPAPSTGQKIACAPIRVHFALDSDQLYDSEKPMLERTANCLRDSEQQRVSIVGNADERGSEEYNRRLGERRAQTVARYLEDNGVQRAQIESVVSHGKDSPICRESDPKCWQLNRRTAVRESCHL